MILIFLSFFLLPVAAAILIRRVFKLKKNMGALEYAFKKGPPILHALILIMTVVLIGLNFIRELDLLTVFAVCGAGVLGFAITFKDLLFTHASGIYANGIIWPASFVFCADVDEYRKDDDGSLVVLTRDRTRKHIVLNNASLIERICDKLAGCTYPLQ